MTEIKEFGVSKDGKKVTKYTIKNSKGMEVSAIDLGAVITNVIVPEKDGKSLDVVLGYDNCEGYNTNVPSFGAAVGRCANRISGARFTLNGKEYKLDDNNKGNCLHSGFNRLNFFMYETETGSSQKGEYVRFHRVSPPEEQGFPGNLDYSITYTLTEENELIITYNATTDEDTVLNMTNHSYFNIGPGGEAGEEIFGLLLKVNSGFYTPVDENIIPTGEIKTVENTPLDFTDFRVIGDMLEKYKGTDWEIAGYDHNYVLNNDGKLVEAAEVRSQETGISMKVYTDLPGVQLYTAPTLYEEGGKGGRTYNNSTAVCLETQYFPNAINTEEFESPVLKAGDKYESVTIYKFGLF